MSNWIFECPACGNPRYFDRRADASRAYREGRLCMSCSRRDVWPGQAKEPYRAQDTPKGELELRIKQLEARLDALEQEAQFGRHDH